MSTKVTTELEVGDVLVKGTESMKITALQIVPDSVLYKVSAIRRYVLKGKKAEGKTFFYCGREAIHQLQGASNE